MSMDGEGNGNQEAAQDAENAPQQQGQERKEAQQGQLQVGDAGAAAPDWEKQIAERDERIASLEAQVAEAAKNAETADALRGGSPSSKPRVKATALTSNCSSRACAT